MINPENPAAAIRSLHPGIFLAGYADGSVSAIPLDVDADTLNRLMTIAGSEAVERP
ncbi:MAG: H-X9-DG-CTERM domain-containing protein [Planctomycetota bacterium]